VFLVALLLQGCSAVEGLLPIDPPSVEIVSTVTPEPTYFAPTLPPEYTLTPTVTLTPTSPPSPTPFQVVAVEETGEPEEGAPPTATPVLFVGQWEPYESRRLGASIRVPPELDVYDYGQGIRVGDPGVLSGDSLLFLEILFDQSNSYRLPDGIDTTNPRNVLEAVIREVEQDFTELQLVRPIQDVYFNSIAASDVAARASLETSNSEININWYLAVAIHDETVVRFYGSSPASASVAYITVAERIADSFSFIE
jgi:hypothetical protein